MVPALKDLTTRHIFTPDEIRAIVTRRRKSEYLLQRRGGGNTSGGGSGKNGVTKSDYLKYIEEEILLERLRKLRKEKVLREMRRRREKQGRKESEDDDGSNDDGDTRKRAAAYKTSGPGDSHIVQHIHFLYQRLLKKFHYDLDICFNYIQFCKDFKSFGQLGRVYAEALQRHPREEGLWIEAAGFEFFGMLDAQDGDGRGRNGEEDDYDEQTRIVGSSIQNARVLMQRGLRINGSTSKELWIQYFALELHYVQKLRGRKEILELGLKANTAAGESGDEETDSDSTDGNDEESESRKNEGENTGMGNDGRKRRAKITNTMLLPSNVIYKNAIKAIPSNVSFRLGFIEICRLFPQTKCLENYILETIERDFGEDVEAWVARISYAQEEMKRKSRAGKTMSKMGSIGFLAKIDSNGTRESGESNTDDRPSKKARVEEKKDPDPALSLLHEALEAVPTAKMYLECTRFLRIRIRLLREYSPDGNNNTHQDDDDDDEDGQNDTSFLLYEDEDAESAARRHALLLERLYANAKDKSLSSPSLTLDQVDYLLDNGKPTEAEFLLSQTLSDSNTTKNHVHLWLKWAELSERMISAGMSPSLPPVVILRRAFKHTPIHEREAHLLFLTNLMKSLMLRSSSSEREAAEKENELKGLFQQLLLLSRGSMYAIDDPTKTKSKEGDSIDEGNESGEKVNLAEVFLSYLQYNIIQSEKSNKNNDMDDSIRSIYSGVLFHSSYGKSCKGKDESEVTAMKSFFDACLRYELVSSSTSKIAKKRVGADKKKKRATRQANNDRICKLYEAAISFFRGGGGGGFWRVAVDGYQRGLQNFKCGM